MTKTYRVFPKDKITGVTKTQIACPMKSLAHVSSLPNLPARFVLLFLGSPDLREVDLNVGGELQSRPVERARLLLG